MLLPGRRVDQTLRGKRLAGATGQISQVGTGIGNMSLFHYGLCPLPAVVDSLLALRADCGDPPITMPDKFFSSAHFSSVREFT